MMIHQDAVSDLIQHLSPDQVVPGSEAEDQLLVTPDP